MLRWFTTIEISVEIMLEGYMFLFIVIIVVIVALRGSIICGAFVERGFLKIMYRNYRKKNKENTLKKNRKFNDHAIFDESKD